MAAVARSLDDPDLFFASFLFAARYLFVASAKAIGSFGLYLWVPSGRGGLSSLMSLRIFSRFEVKILVIAVSLQSMQCTTDVSKEVVLVVDLT